jgi:hypothetical protein
MYTYFVEMKVCFYVFFLNTVLRMYMKNFQNCTYFLRIVQKFRVVFTLQNFGIGQTDRYFFNDNIPKWYFFK